MVLCGRNEFYDAITGLCNTCASISACDPPTESCPQVCHFYGNNRSDTGTNAGTGSEETGSVEVIMPLILVMTLLILATVFINLVVICNMRPWHKWNHTGVVDAASGDNVPFLSANNQPASSPSLERSTSSHCEVDIDENCAVSQCSDLAPTTDGNIICNLVSISPSAHVHRDLSCTPVSAQYSGIQLNTADEVDGHQEHCEPQAFQTDTVPKLSSASNSAPVQESCPSQPMYIHSFHSHSASTPADIAVRTHSVDVSFQYQQQQPQHQNASAISFASYDVEARARMFGWLNSQSWVSQYFEVGLEVHIAVENINRREAYTKIREAADRLAPEFEFKIVDPLVGKYIPCPFLSARNGCDTECLQIVADKVVLTPGVKIFCERMEPVVPGEKVESGCALYSCSIKLPGSIERGLTVGHLFEDIGLECTVHCNSLSSSVSVGRCHTKITFVDLVDSLRKTTADLALLDVFCQVENTVVIDNVTYLLKLHHGFLNTKHCPRVAILSDSGQLRYGQVDSTLFTVSALGLYNTLSIVAPDNSWSRVNNPGDSGALVISVPDPKVGNELLVYGMVIGYFESDDGTQSKTVATRLGDILNYVNKMSQFHDAPCNLESGYMSFVSFE